MGAGSFGSREFTTSNGPDVRVYLVAATDAVDNETVTKAGFVELGKLKGNEGDQNYDVPADLDLASTGRSRSGATASASTSPPRRSRRLPDRETCHVARSRSHVVGGIAWPRPRPRRRRTSRRNSPSRSRTSRRGEALKLSNGKTAPFVSAPVLWVIHSGSTNPLFVGGQPDAGNGLETLAETGNPGPLLRSLTGAGGVASAGADDHAGGRRRHGPITPGQGYEFEISAVPGQILSIAWMFGQSNDLFYSNDRPIALFDAAGKPVRAT